LCDATANPGVPTAAGAPKQLLEHLDETDAGALALVVEHLQYIPLGELPHVPDKAPRDAPTIAVANL